MLIGVPNTSAFSPVPQLPLGKIVTEAIPSSSDVTKQKPVLWRQRELNRYNDAIRSVKVFQRRCSQTSVVNGRASFCNCLNLSLNSLYFFSQVFSLMKVCIMQEHNLMLFRFFAAVVLPRYFSFCYHTSHQSFAKPFFRWIMFSKSQCYETGLKIAMKLLT